MGGLRQSSHRSTAKWEHNAEAVWRTLHSKHVVQEVCKIPQICSWKAASCHKERWWQSWRIDVLARSKRWQAQLSRSGSINYKNQVRRYSSDTPPDFQLTSRCSGSWSMARSCAMQQSHKVLQCEGLRHKCQLTVSITHSRNPHSPSSHQPQTAQAPTYTNCSLLLFCFLTVRWYLRGCYIILNGLVLFWSWREWITSKIFMHYLMPASE